MQRIVSLSVLCIIVFMLATAATAQDGESTGGTAMRVFDHFLVQGGAITWFILVPLSLATIALSVEYTMSIRRQTFVPQDTFQEIAERIANKQYTEALTFTADEPSVLSAVVNTGLMESANGYAAMERAVEEALEYRSAKIMRKIEYLNVIGNISPMVGLFGTVYGMIGLFSSMREAGGMPEPARLADDISIALVTTFWGLLVAIPALSVFALFRNRIDELTAECALATDRLLEPFKPGTNSQTPNPPN